MYVIDIKGKDAELFRSTVNNLCVGSLYEFSAYLANVQIPLNPEPNVRFEVRAALGQDDLLAQFYTGNITAKEKMTWSKYCVSFNASSFSVVLLIISNIGDIAGNDLAIDDIELRVCSPAHLGCCPPVETTMTQKTATTARPMMVHSTNVLSTLALTTKISTERHEKETTTEITTVQTTSKTVKSTDMTSFIVPTTTPVQSTTIQSTIVQYATVQATPIELTSVQSTRIQSTAVQSITVQSTPVQSTTVQSTRIQSTAVQSATVQPTPVQSTAVQSTAVQSTTVQCTRESQTSIKQSTPFFIPPQCNVSTYIGCACNVSNKPCEMQRPCKNNGTCNNINTTLLGYNCSCPFGFNGTHCELDYRLCKPHTCWNDGTCNETLDGRFRCECTDGWQGVYCESMINLCNKGTCMNNGVCRPLLNNYTCECLGNSYSGIHCEIVAKKIVIYRIVSQSFAYIAIIAMTTVAMFVVIMDILKYCFGIDPVDGERERIRREKQAKKRKTPVFQRFVYVNAPSKASEQAVISTTELTV